MAPLTRACAAWQICKKSGKLDLLQLFTIPSKMTTKIVEVSLLQLAGVVIVKQQLYAVKEVNLAILQCFRDNKTTHRLHVYYLCSRRDALVLHRYYVQRTQPETAHSKSKN